MEEDQQHIEKILYLLYWLEEKEGYKNNAVGKCINYLQKKYMKSTRQDIEKMLDEMGNDDETLPLLEKAFHDYCETWDKCEAYKNGIRATLADQYDNHEAEQTPGDLIELSGILNGTI